MRGSIQVTGVRGLPLIRKGDDLPALICEHCSLQNGDVLSIASSVYSKAKGYTRDLADITPSAEAERLGVLNHEDPRFVQSVLDSSEEVILDHPFILSVLRFGHVGVRAGVDQSNVEDNQVILLPSDPMAAAEEVREEVRNCSGADIGVIITDTCGRSFRRGQTGHAIGWAGMVAIRDFRGDTDLFGHVLKITEEAVVDEIAGFANYVMGESHNGVPVVHFRNLEPWKGHDEIYFSEKEDIFRQLLTKCREK